MSNDLVKIEIDDRQVKEMLARLKAKLDDLEPVMRRIAQYKENEKLLSGTLKMSSRPRKSPIHFTLILSSCQILLKDKPGIGRGTFLVHINITAYFRAGSAVCCRTDIRGLLIKSKSILWSYLPIPINVGSA